jgi:hypothetical protein
LYRFTKLWPSMTVSTTAPLATTEETPAREYAGRVDRQSTYPVACTPPSNLRLPPPQRRCRRTRGEPRLAAPTPEKPRFLDLSNRTCRGPPASSSLRGCCGGAKRRRATSGDALAPSTVAKTRPPSRVHRNMSDGRLLAFFMPYLFLTYLINNLYTTQTNCLSIKAHFISQFPSIQYFLLYLSKICYSYNLHSKM